MNNNDWDDLEGPFEFDDSTTDCGYFSDEN